MLIERKKIEVCKHTRTQCTRIVSIVILNKYIKERKIQFLVARISHG